MVESAIYAVNSSDQAVEAGASQVISFGSPVRKFGKSLAVSGGNVAIESSGYYKVIANVGFTVGAGNVTVTVYCDGVAVPGATASTTVSAATNLNTLVIPCMVRNKCCCESTVTVVITSAGAGNVTNAAIEVTKI